MKAIITLLAFTVIVSMGGCKKKSTNEPTSNNSSPIQNATDIDSVSFNTEIGLRDYFGMPQNNTFSSFSFVRYYNVTLNTSDSIGIFGGSSYWHKFAGGGALSVSETDSTTANVKFHQQYFWMVNTITIPDTQYLTTKVSPYMNTSFFQNVNSISKSSGITINHPTIFCTKVDYYISDNSNLYITPDGNVNLGGSYHYVKKMVNGNSTGVVFTPSDLSSLSNTSLGFICARAYNTETIHPTTSVLYSFKNTTKLIKSGFPITN